MRNFKKALCCIASICRTAFFRFCSISFLNFHVLYLAFLAASYALLNIAGSHLPSSSSMIFGNFTRIWSYYLPIFSALRCLLHCSFPAAWIQNVVVAYKCVLQPLRKSFFGGVKPVMPLLLLYVMLVLVRLGYFISPVPTISGRHSPNRYLRWRPIED